MSFINSVLSSIGGGGESTPPSGPGPRGPSTTRSTAQQPTKHGIIPNGAAKSNGAMNTGMKRKAEEELPRPADKAPKRDTSSLPARPAAPTDRFQPSKPVIKSTSSTSAAQFSTQGATKPAAPIPPPAAAIPKVPPKKGSYAEILARAKAAQNASVQVGAIKHKPAEKLTRKERLALQAEAASKPKHPAAKDRKDIRDTKAKSPGLPVAKGAEPETVKKKQPVDVGYKGTARPKTEKAPYKGTINRAGPSSGSLKGSRDDRDRDRSRSASLGRTAPGASRYRYASYSDEEEEEDYESEGSSDMEAAAFELEEEEQRSLKTARKEDEEALRQEMELKKMKEEKRKKLAQMAARRK